MLTSDILRRLLLAVAALALLSAAALHGPASAAVFPSHSLSDDGE